METKQLHGVIERKFAVTDDTKTLSGYGARFNNTDSYSDIIVPGAFKKSLAAHTKAGTAPAMLFNHRYMDLPIGVWTSFEEDADGLKIEGKFLDTTVGTDAYKAVKAGAVTGLSIGFIVTGFEMEKNGDVVVRHITEVELIEVSVVNFPANDLARIEDVKAAANDSAAVATSQASTATVSAIASSATEGVTADTDGDAETKYNVTEIDAVTALILKLKQENYVR